MAKLKKGRKKTVNNVELGKRVLKEIADIPLSQLTGVASVETVSSTWEDRPRSNIVKWLMDRSGCTMEDVATALGCSVPYLNNKLHRDSFSLDDMIIVAYICGYSMTFTSNDPEKRDLDTVQIDVKDYFAARDMEALDRLLLYEYEMKERKYLEYEELKAQLAKMKETYGFKD